MVHVEWSKVNLDKRLCRHLPRHSLWETKEHEFVYVCRMTLDHLEHTIKFIETRLERGDYRYMDEAVLMNAYAYVANHDNEAAHSLDMALRAQEQRLNPFGGLDFSDDFGWDGLDPMFEFGDGAHTQDAKSHLSILYAERDRRKSRLHRITPKTIRVSVDPNQEVIDLALGYLNYDDSHPDVGPGMGYTTAINEAIKTLAAKYGAKFESSVNMATVLDAVKKARSRR